MSKTFYYFSIFLGFLVQLQGISGQCTSLGMTVDVAAGMATETYTWMLASSLNPVVRIAGNDDPLPGQSINSGTDIEYSYDFPIGSTAVTVFGSNPDTEVICSFDFVVNDVHAPVIFDCPPTPPEDLEFTESQKVTWTTPTVTDNSGRYTLVQTAGPQPDQEFPVGMTTITYEARDPSDNVDTCSFMITVTDEINAPVITGCPPAELGGAPALRVEADMGESTQSVTWTEPMVDPATGLTATRSRNRIPGSEFVIGSTYVLYNFTSDQDPTIQTECAFYIIVSRFRDTQAPVVTCPSNILTVGDLNNPTTMVTWDFVPPTDNVGVASFSFFPPNGASFGIGVTSVLFSAIDTSGNQADCFFSVTVIENTDTDGPIFTNCPADFEVLVPDGRSTAIVNWSPPTVFDESSTTTTSTLTPPVELAVDQSHTVVYTAVDAASLTATCTFTITVGRDMSPPIMNCGAFSPITRYVREVERNTPISISWNEPSPLATDNSGQVSVVRTKTPGSLFLPGIIETVRYTATDGAGLTTECSFMVSVVVDPAPTFQGCTDYSRVTDMDSDTASFVLVHPMATDVDPETPSLAPLVNPPTVIPPEFPIGTTTLRWTATDSRGSVTECVINVIVSDGQAPVILGCPDNFEVSVENSTFRSALVTWTPPQVQENSGQTVNLISTISPGSILGPGNYTVQYIARDGFNNEASCNFHVTVRDLPGDNVPPLLMNCPSNIFAVALQDLDYNDEITWIPPTATDNEDTNVDLISSHNPFQRFFIGETTVTYTAIDDRNNRQACSFQVIVQDDQNPVFSECPNNVFQYVNLNTVSTLIKFDDVLVTDNSGSVQRDENFQSRELVANSPVTINLVATDPSGNPASCLVVVTIEETSEVFTYPGHVVISEFRDQAIVPGNLETIQSDLDDHFRCSSLANDFVGIRLTGSPNFNISYELSFYRGSDNNQYSERGRYISRTIEQAFVDALTGSPPRIFPPGNAVLSDSFQLDVCEFRGTFTLVSSSGDGSDLLVAPLLVAGSVAELELRELIHEQLDRTYQGQTSFISSVVLRPFSVSILAANAIVVNFVLVFQDTSTVAPPAESTVVQLFEDELRYDSILDKTQLGTSSLFVSPTVAFSIIKICGGIYCLNRGVCTVDDSFSPVCQCQFGFTGTRCETSTITFSPITVAPGPGGGSSGDSAGLSQGAIIGIIAGAIGLLLLLLLLGCCCCFLLFAGQPKAGPVVAPIGPPPIGPPVPFEEPLALVPQRRPRAIAYSAPPPYIQEEPFVEMLVPEPVSPSSLVSYHGPAYRSGPIIEEIDSYHPYKRPYLDPYF